MPRFVRNLLAVSLIALLVAGCGNKGPLVLPDQAPKAKKSSTDKEKRAAVAPARETGEPDGPR